MPGKALAVAIAVCSVTASFAAGVGPTRADAVSLQKKVDDIKAFSAQPASRQPRRITITENEVNAYLTYELKDDIPAGVIEPGLSALGSGRVTARAVVDLDAVRKQKVRGLLDPLNYVSGRLPMTATGVLTTSNGVARMQFESAAIGRLPVPKLVLSEIVSFYSRSESRPSGIDIDDPFELPARIREIHVETGHAIVVQ